MLYELQIIKSLLDREVYVNYRSYISRKEFPKELHIFLDCIDKLQSTESCSLNALVLEVMQRVGESTDTIETLHVLETLEVAHNVPGLLEALKTRRVCEDISLVAYEASRGSTDLVALFSLVDKLKHPKDALEVEYVTDDLTAILDSTVKTPGLRWRLQSLNKSLGSLRKGDFGFLFARPEVGKTTFLASEGTFMAEQALAKGLGPGIWFN